MFNVSSDFHIKCAGEISTNRRSVIFANRDGKCPLTAFVYRKQCGQLGGLTAKMFWTDFLPANLRKQLRDSMNSRLLYKSIKPRLVNSPQVIDTSPKAEKNVF